MLIALRLAHLHLMRRRDRQVEVIDIFDPHALPVDAAATPLGEGAVQARQRTAGTPSGSGHRSVVAGAVLAAVLLVGGAVAVFTDSSGGSERDRDGTNTTAAPTTTVRSQLAPVDPSLANRQFIAHPAAVGLRLYTADVLSPAPADRSFRLWGTGTSRRWLLVETGDGDRSYAVVGGERRQIGEFEAALLPHRITGGDDVLLAAAHDADRWALVHAFGFRDADLVAVLGALDPSTGPSSVARTASQVGAGRALGEGADVHDLLFGTGRTAMRYLTPTAAEVVLRIGEGDVADGATARGLLSSNLERGDVTSGRLVTTGEHYVTWEHEGRIATLLSTAVPTETLRDYVPQVQVATAEQWRALLYGSRPDYRLGEFATTTGGVSADGEAWRAGVQAAHRAGRTEYLWWWDVPGDPTRSASTAAPQELAMATTAVAFDVVVVPGATFVFVAAPDTSSRFVPSVVDGAGVTHRLDYVRPFPDAPFTVAVVRLDAFGAVSEGM